MCQRLLGKVREPFVHLKESAAYNMKTSDQQFRLRRFWGTAIFSLGVLWGISNLVYSPIAALTSIAGSSWLEVAVILAGGFLTFCASVGAFYRRGLASAVLLYGGVLLLLIAIAARGGLHSGPSGILNDLLLFLSGGVAIALGIFGSLTHRKGWPSLRASQPVPPK